ncbi:MAG: LCP family protein [Halanaerobium sp.]|nr:LCP family protein [Halanaerobium sp.]
MEARKLGKRVLLVSLFVVLALISTVITIYFLSDSTDFSVFRKFWTGFDRTKLNILVVGYDSSINGSPRADTIMLVSIDMEDKKAGILSIPRDTRVIIPGKEGYQKINASHAYGGIELTKKTIEEFLDVPVDYYVESDFAGFQKIIDILGGVEINVEKALNYEDRAGGLYIDIPAGMQRLDGEKALQYVRYRGELYGDIGRIQRQQKFLRAVTGQLLRGGTILKLPDLIKEISTAVDTNFTVNDLLKLFKLMKDIELHDLEMATLPGDPANISGDEPGYAYGGSYWIPREDEAKLIVDNLIRSKDYLKNNQYKVGIYNGNGVKGMAHEMASKLSQCGYNVAFVGNAENFAYPQTVIYYNPDSKESAEKINNILQVEMTRSEPGSGLLKAEGQELDIALLLGKDLVSNSAE